MSEQQADKIIELLEKLLEKLFEHNETTASNTVSLAFDIDKLELQLSNHLSDKH